MPVHQGEDLDIRRCGDSALLVNCPDIRMVQSIHDALRTAQLTGIVDLIPAARTVLVKFDPAIVDQHELDRQVRTLPRTEREGGDTSLVHIPVSYDGVDLEYVTQLTGLTVEELIAAHTGHVWEVAFCGFAPGFAYLTGGDPRLDVPRRAESRTKVPSGAVAVAGGFSAVYPRESPGGWQLIGHTDVRLWDVTADPPALLRPGTAVRFVDRDRS